MNGSRPDPLPAAPLDGWLAAVRRAVPAVDALLARGERLCLRDYVAELAARRPAGFQDRQDFIDACADRARDTLGPRSAAALADDLARYPGVITAHHHGIDTFAQSTQTNLLFAQRFGLGDGAARTVPVLACGSVPLNNLTYPRGLLVYATGDAAGPGDIVRVPIFPDSRKRCLVSAAAAFTADMLERSRARARRAVAERRIAAGLGGALERVFDRLAEGVDGEDDYSRQASRANHRIWPLLFAGEETPAELIYLELEQVVTQLLRKDLFDADAVCNRLLFDREARACLLHNLDGQRACWRAAALPPRPGAAQGGAAAGTMFFWGVDTRGRGFPLGVDDAGAGATLRGVDGRGQPWQCPLNPRAVERALAEGRLLPSLFTSYLCLAIARGVDCIGGYYQAGYLPVMRQGAIAALNGKCLDTARAADAPPDPYLSGMQAVGYGAAGELRPAGPIEIAAGGGLDREDWRRIGEITLGQAHIGSLYDTLVDTAPADVDVARAKRELAGLVYAAVGRRLPCLDLP